MRKKKNVYQFNWFPFYYYTWYLRHLRIQVARMNTFCNVSLILTSADYGGQEDKWHQLSLSLLGWIERSQGLRPWGDPLWLVINSTHLVNKSFISPVHISCPQVPESATFAHSWGRELFEKLENQEAISLWLLSTSQYDAKIKCQSSASQPTDVWPLASLQEPSRINLNDSLRGTSSSDASEDNFT